MTSQIRCRPTSCAARNGFGTVRGYGPDRGRDVIHLRQGRADERGFPVKIHLIHSRSRVRAAVLVAVGAMAVAGPVAIAVAAKPEKGKTYKGYIVVTSTDKYAISFTVAKSGKRVSSFSMPGQFPWYCQGGGWTYKSASAKISSKGTFTAKLPIVDNGTSTKVGTLKLTGKFASGGKESGKAITDFTKSKSCNGTSPYSTTAS